MEEDIEELLKRKDDYDFAYGTKIHRPYVMSEKDWELIENLLTRYKESELENNSIKYLNEGLRLDKNILTDRVNDLQEQKRNSIPKSKIKEKIKELNKQIEEFKANLVTAKEEIEQAYWKSEMSKAIAKRSVLQELLEEE